MRQRRKPINYFNVFLLAALIAVGVYLNYYVVPNVQTPFVPTPTPTRPPESFVTEARQFFEEGKMLQAIASYQEAVKANPQDAAAYLAMSRAQIWAGKYADAQMSAENALLLNEANSTAHAVRGWALLFQGDLLQAEAAVKRAIEIDPNNALPHAIYAEILSEQYLNGTGPLNIIDLMSEESKVAISLGPDLFEAHRARGYVLEVTQNNLEAINEYEAAAAINDNIADIYLALGRNYRALGVYDKAVDALTRANTLNPADPTPDLIISRIYATIGEFPKAEQYAEQAVRDSPVDPLLRGNLGVMYGRNSKYPEALVELNFAVNGGTTEEGETILGLELESGASPRVAEYYFTYGLVLARSFPPRCGEALPVAQQILTKIPGDETSVFNANEIIRLCTDTAATPFLDATAEPETTPEVTPTP